MNQLEVRNVNFQGNSLLAIQDKKTGKVFTAINNVLRGLGFDEKQVEYQRSKWVEDKSILKGTLKFSGTSLGMKTGKEAWCIDIMKLPLALAKINITPKIQSEMPELAERLEIYQDRCADALAKEFNIYGSAGTEQKSRKVPLSSVNNSVKFMAKLYQDAGVEPSFIALAASKVYKEAAGINFDAPITTPEEHLYDKTTMAEMMGVYSNSGNPHPLYIGAVMSHLSITPDEIVNAPYNNHGHSGVAEQYKQSVYDKVQAWIIENDYPGAVRNNENGNNIKAKFTLPVIN
ncbi:phage antirepressor N-terminal domain-containing protein [Anaerocolumna jejuensis]|uniref:phage antirepressor N-terminal domain-containing protein n=1 Tax=Anaerocolumna jejuensis TaxID=259063 RepID=UPI003F7B4D21